MSPTKPAILAASIAAALVLAFAAPAGTGGPNLIRQVHLKGVSGPAYYSVIEGGYRPVGAASRIAENRAAEVADTAAPAN